jgi:hypothetical protein
LLIHRTSDQSLKAVIPSTDMSGAGNPNNASKSGSGKPFYPEGGFSGMSGPGFRRHYVRPPRPRRAASAERPALSVD